MRSVVVSSWARSLPTMYSCILNINSLLYLVVSPPMFAFRGIFFFIYLVDSKVSSEISLF
uniref:Uncharacterized protein n=1 Tax=Arundo donax TaxID=35708 RepID=A0A0A9EA98_ARUDO